MLGIRSQRCNIIWKKFKKQTKRDNFLRKVPHRVVEKTRREMPSELQLLSSLHSAEETVDHFYHLQELLNTLNYDRHRYKFPLKYDKV